MLRLLVGYLLFVNVLAYLVFWLDKRRARTGGRRVPERELLLWVLAGGSVGAFLAMRRLRHKTRKTWFVAAFVGVVALQVALVWFLVWGRD